MSNLRTRLVWDTSQPSSAHQVHQAEVAKSTDGQGVAMWMGDSEILVSRVPADPGNNSLECLKQNKKPQNPKTKKQLFGGPCRLSVRKPSRSFRKQLAWPRGHVVHPQVQQLTTATVTATASCPVLPRVLAFQKWSIHCWGFLRWQRLFYMRQHESKCALGSHPDHKTPAGPVTAPLGPHAATNPAALTKMPPQLAILNVRAPF